MQIEIKSKDLLNIIGVVIVGGFGGCFIGNGMYSLFENSVDKTIRDEVCTQQVKLLDDMYFKDNVMDKSKYDYYKNELVWKSTAGIVSKCFQNQK